MFKTKATLNELVSNGDIVVIENSLMITLFISISTVIICLSTWEHKLVGVKSYT